MTEPVPSLAAPPPSESVPDAASLPQRPHPLTPLVRGWVVFVAIVVGFGQQLVEQGSRAETGWTPPWWAVALAVLGVVLLAALVSLAGWWWTRYVIDDTELRIETGMLTKRSRRIPFAKVQSIDVIQPLLARIFGLCELRIEAGGGDSSVALRYLKRDRAYLLRDYLLERAHGRRTTLEQTGQRPQAGVFQDLAEQDRVLVRLSPGRLVTGWLLSVEFFGGLVALVVLAVVAVALAVPQLVVAGILPTLAGLWGSLRGRVLTQFSYTLAQTGSGLRVTRGLTNLTSQSLPVDRVQGVRIAQSWLWRRLGLHRVFVDVLGYGKEGNDNKKAASAQLLPVASTDEVRVATAHLLPLADDENIPLVTAPARARWLAPIKAHTLKHGWNEHVMVSEMGLLYFRRDTVPHAKTQSVRITQGPLERLLRLATVHVDNTDGPVTLTIPHIDLADARALFDAQLPQAARARGLEAGVRARLRQEHS